MGRREDNFEKCEAFKKGGSWFTMPHVVIILDSQIWMLKFLVIRLDFSLTPTFRHSWGQTVKEVVIKAMYNQESPQVKHSTLIGIGDKHDVWMSMGWQVR